MGEGKKEIKRARRKTMGQLERSGRTYKKEKGKERGKRQIESR